MGDKGDWLSRASEPSDLGLADHALIWFFVLSIGGAILMGFSWLFG